MKRRYVGLAMGAVIAVGMALSLPSCGHDQKLVSIALTPQTATYPSPGSGAVDFAASGTYIHPPETRDITAQVTWSTDVTELLTFKYLAGTGETVAPNNGNCGIANVWASAPEGTGGTSNIVISPPSTVTVQNTANPLCPGGSNTAGELVLTPAGTGAGTVTSSPRHQLSGNRVRLRVLSAEQRRHVDGRRCHRLDFRRLLYELCDLDDES